MSTFCDVKVVKGARKTFVNKGQQKQDDSRQFEADRTIKVKGGWEGFSRLSFKRGGKGEAFRGGTFTLIGH